MMTMMTMTMTMTMTTRKTTSLFFFPSFIRTVSAFTTSSTGTCTGSRSSAAVSVSVSGNRLQRNKIHHFNGNGGNGNIVYHMQLYSTTSTDASSASSAGSASAESSSSSSSSMGKESQPEELRDNDDDNSDDDNDNDDDDENDDDDIKTTPGSTRNKNKNNKKNSTRRSRNRNRRKEESKLGESTKGELSWDSFDFGLNPKQDNRFSNMNNNEIASNNNGDREELVYDQERETLEDKKCSNKLRTINDAYMKLDPILVSKATSILEPWINDKRQQRITTVLNQRTRNVKFLYENPSNPSNVWACLRTIDSFGIQNVDLIIDSSMYGEGKQTLMQKRGMRTAMGSAQWLTLTNYPSTKEAIQHIRDVQGYKIYASDLNPNSIDIRYIDWDNNNDNNNNDKNDNTNNDENNQDQNQEQDQRPICIVMGNEDRGISDEMRLLADETFTLPMYGTFLGFVSISYCICPFSVNVLSIPYRSSIFFSSFFSHSIPHILITYFPSFLPLYFKFYFQGLLKVLI
jgi:tRNA G18 (ribose-2'-O)-methylase SpoU